MATNCTEAGSDRWRTQASSSAATSSSPSIAARRAPTLPAQKCKTRAVVAELSLEDRARQATARRRSTRAVSNRTSTGFRKKSSHCGAAELPRQVGSATGVATAGQPSYPGRWVQRKEQPLRGGRATQA
eukprot:15435407-Alexandrium_andersonii.AAC.1